jgi:hypothetical protein
MSRDAAPQPVMLSSVGVGDKAGEYTVMERGQYSAWLYVAIGFGLNAFLWGLPLMLGLEALRHGQPMSDGMVAFTSLVGAIPAFVTFHDRWRCVEAFTSRSLSGIMNLSLLYAPIVALVYANYRGIKKFSGE